ncbi:MAG: hypothetical protein VXZ75_05135 [Candidatus Thermoplasmatota archaeon]|nr:hypothetical protein [Candidatus Thermoplasmatota archaeon]MEC8363482.1 hypothetical protein [Candidatus Thermoplasmatota archaeon]
MAAVSPMRQILNDFIAISIPTSIWVWVVLQSSFQSGWFSFICSGMVGFFLWLTSVAYGEVRFGRMIMVGVVMSAILSLASAMYRITM